MRHIEKENKDKLDMARFKVKLMLLFFVREPVIVVLCHSVYIGVKTEIIMVV